MALTQMSYPRALSEYGSLADYTTTGNDWADAGTWNVQALKTKALYFTATTKDLSVQILGSLNGGTTYPITVETSFAVATATPVKKQITDYYTNLKVQVKPAAEGQHGTLSTQLAGASF